MLITGIENGTYLGRPAVSGLVQWEDCGRPDLRVHFASGSEREHLSSSGNPFLIGGLLPALKFREQRIRVDAPTCPWLRSNLATVAAYYDHWFYAAERRLKIEGNEDAAPECMRRRTAAFFSGGVDSLHALHENKRGLDRDHPGRVQDALVMLGFEIRVQRSDAEDAFALALEQVGSAAEALEVGVVPILSNLRELNADGTFWGDVFQAAILSASAHALAPRYSDVLLASSADIANLSPYGTHPAVDPKLSSYGLRIHHQGERLTRLEKLRDLVDWGADLSRLRVCPKSPVDRLNCGRCEKCVRVKLELLVIGALQGPGLFETPEVVPEDLSGLPIEGGVIIFYADVVPGLLQIGRADLARAVLSRIVRDMPRRMQGHLEDALKDLDHTLLRDRLRHWVRRQRYGNDS